MSPVHAMTNSDTKDLYQLVYISRITTAGLVGSSTLNDIAKLATQNNYNNDITGILCYGNGYFFQCVEGREQDLTNLKNRLLLDDRHKDLKILDFSELDERHFSGWSLRSIVLERCMVKDMRIKALMPFKPYSWNCDEYLQFLEVLHHLYDDIDQKGESDTQPIKYSALGVTLSKVVGEHQAFFLIQSVLALLIIMTIPWLLMADKI